MTLTMAWRSLSHEKSRSALAIAGIFIALLMVFLELGFYFSVPRAGMLVYDRLRFDVLVASSNYISQVQPFDFSRRRLYQALELPEVASVTPVYEAEGGWLNPDGRLRRDVFVIGVRPEDDVFAVAGIERRMTELQQPDTILIDSQSLPAYGPKRRGTVVEINGRQVTIAGSYQLGTAFLGLGAAVASDTNFIRIFPARNLSAPNLGLIRLKPDADAEAVVTKLRQMLPADTTAFSRADLTRREIDYWTRRTATGIVFGFGVVVSVIVGMLILHQTLSAQIIRQLPQYATLKAIGYTHADLGRSVVATAILLTGVAFAAASVAAVLVYGEVRGLSRLPIEMTGNRVLVVLAVAIGMAVLSALLALRAVRRADPAELF